MNALRETVATMRQMVLETLADSMMLTWGPVSIHVTAVSARAVTPGGPISLDSEAGLRLLAGMIEFVETPA